MPAPADPKIYHITHIDNLASILAAGCLQSDARMIAAGGPATAIGMYSIKQRRMALPVRCHPGDHVGEYVPFYFCSRSVMLYLLHKGNHPEVDYRGGQSPIVHLEADLKEAVAWAVTNGRRWAFTLSNAGAFYAEFRSDLAALGEIGWDAVASTQWSSPDIREAKQAEFLMRKTFPWGLVTRVGVHSMAIKARVDEILQAMPNRPRVDIQPTWYY